jgi:putative restriction endonuclease
MVKNNWTIEQTIVAFNVYCKIPFKKSSKSHPIIIKYAQIIGRSPSALNMKVGNFGRLDPELRRKGIVGLSNGSKLEEDVWNSFHGNWEALAFESEKLIAKFEMKNVEESAYISLEDLPIGIERERIVKARVNQSFFRSTVLASYNQKCCITGLSIPALLIASHIIPWSKNSKERLNPKNGLCLNSLHDKAFDRGLLTITTDYKIKLSNEVKKQSADISIQQFFLKYNHHRINLPDRFLPNKDFLKFHNDEVFKNE